MNITWAESCSPSYSDRLHPVMTCENTQEIIHNLEVATINVPLSWWDYIPGGLKIKEYFDLTSLHGLKYFSEPGRSLSERYFWIIALSLVYVAAVIAVYDQFTYFLHTPVLMSIDSVPTSVWDIPFPAVTICSENQVRPSFFNHSAFSDKAEMTQEELEIYEYLLITCQSNATGSRLQFLSSDVMDRVHREVWKHCNNTYLLRWMSEIVEDPCEIFQPVLMPGGACHTFNGLPGDLLFRPAVYSTLAEHNHKIKSSDEGMIWSQDKGYTSRNSSKSPPWRMPGGGFGQDAFFVLDLNKIDFDNTCFFGGHGFLVTLHNPAELPTLAHPSTYVHVDHLAMIKVTPDLKVTDSELRRWDPIERGCFFEDERPLKYFNLYTENNCDLECETNISLLLCGCAPFFGPRTKDIPVCGPLKQRCYIESISRSLDPKATGCNCLPSCFEIGYKISVANYRRNYSLAGLKGIKLLRYEQIFEDNFAVISVQYQTQKVTAMKRIAVFSLSDFIANIGGLLGLFLGFSFLSLFEIFYFCALRFNKKHSTKITTSSVKPN